MMDIGPRFTSPDDRDQARRGRRKAVRRFERRLARWLERFAGPDALAEHHLPNGESDFVVELPMRPGRSRRPFKVRVIVTDYHDD